MLDGILKPKSKEEILKDARICKSLYEFSKFAKKYAEQYNEQIPIEEYPLAARIFSVSESKGQCEYPYNDFILMVKRTELIISKASNPVIDQAVVQMFPVRKIPELEHIRFGNLFMVQNMEQFWTIVRFLNTH
jgi:hypothetical protein